MVIAHVSCYGCSQDDPQERTRHHFNEMEQGLENFRAHIETAYARRSDVKDIVSGLCSWAATLMESYRGRLCEDTGARISWRQARRQAMREKPLPGRWEGKHSKGRAGEHIDAVARGAMQAGRAATDEQEWIVLHDTILRRGLSRSTPGGLAELVKLYGDFANAHPAYSAEAMAEQVACLKLLREGQGA